MTPTRVSIDAVKLRANPTSQASKDVGPEKEHLYTGQALSPLSSSRLESKTEF